MCMNKMQSTDNRLHADKAIFVPGVGERLVKGLCVFCIRPNDLLPEHRISSLFASNDHKLLHFPWKINIITCNHTHCMYDMHRLNDGITYLRCCCPQNRPRAHHTQGEFPHTPFKQRPEHGDNTADTTRSTNTIVKPHRGVAANTQSTGSDLNTWRLVWAPDTRPWGRATGKCPRSAL